MQQEVFNEGGKERGQQPVEAVKKTNAASPDVGNIKELAENPAQERVWRRRTDTHPMRILLINDEHNLRRVIKDLLDTSDRFTDTRFAFVEADRGDAALRMALHEDFDLVVTDLKHEEVRGEDILRLIRIRKPLMPVIVTTGGDVDRELGADKLLYTPFGRKDLEEAIEWAQSESRRRAGWSLPQVEEHMGHIRDVSRRVDDDIIRGSGWPPKAVESYLQEFRSRGLTPILSLVPHGPQVQTNKEGMVLVNLGRRDYELLLAAAPYTATHELMEMRDMRGEITSQKIEIKPYREISAWGLALTESGVEIHRAAGEVKADRATVLYAGTGIVSEGFVRLMETDVTYPLGEVKEEALDLADCARWETVCGRHAQLPGLDSELAGRLTAVRDRVRERVDAWLDRQSDRKPELTRFYGKMISDFNVIYDSTRIIPQNE